MTEKAKCPYYTNPAEKCILVNSREFCDLAPNKSIGFDLECFTYKHRKTYLKNLEKEHEKNAR